MEPSARSLRRAFVAIILAVAPIPAVVGDQVSRPAVDVVENLVAITGTANDLRRLDTRDCKLSHDNIGV